MGLPVAVCLFLLVHAALSQPGIFFPGSTTSSSTCHCSGQTTFTSEDTSGDIKSPNYPNEYCDNLNCKWVIKPGKPGTGIRITFESFNTESGPDVLAVNYVEGSVAQQLTTLTGILEPSLLPKYVFGSQGSFELDFRTDGSVTRPGFIARFSRFNISEEQCACTGFLYRASETEVEITSPNWPKDYCYNLECYYLIRADPSYSVKLNIVDFQTENRYDVLKIYDGNTTAEGNLLRQLSGTLDAKKDPREYVSKRSAMLLVFKTDGDNNYKGFRAKITRTTGPCSCPPGTYSGNSGNFSSPGYPGVYCDELACNYTISVPEGQLVQVDFPVISLLSEDRIEIPNGASDMPLMMWQGTISGTARFTSENNRLQVRFKTASSSTAGPATGFNATYRAVSRASGCGCSPNPQNISNQEGTLSKTACGPLDCYYILIPPSSTGTAILTVWMDRANFESEGDFISVYRNLFPPLKSTAPDVLSTFTGQSTNNPPFTMSNSDGSPAMIYYHSTQASSSSTSGFSLRYQWRMQDCSCGDLDIDANRTQGNLTSPGYPVQYCNNLNCRWRLRAPQGYRIWLRVMDFRIETADNVAIFDGLDGNPSQRIALLAGSMTDLGITEFRSNGSEMAIWFTTDASVVYSGWNITFGIEPNPNPYGGRGAGGAAGTGGFVNCAYQSGGVQPLNITNMIKTEPTSQFGWSFVAGLFLGLFIGAVVILIMTYWDKIRFRNRSIPYKRESSVAYIANHAYEGNQTQAPPPAFANRAYEGNQSSV